MPVITISGRAYPVAKEQPLLDSLLASSVRVPYSCRSGLCHACMLKADSGTPPAGSQNRLEPARARQGYFLACQCFPDSDMTLSLPVRNKIPAIITDRYMLSPTVIALEVSPRHTVHYSPGQYMTLWASEHLARPCYFASADGLDRNLVFHVARRINGAFSSWAHDCTSVGQKISISDLGGEPFCDNPLSPLPEILIAAEECLAPLLSAARSLVAKADNEMTLILVGRNAASFYCLDILESLAEQHNHFTFVTISGQNAREQLASHLASFAGQYQISVSGDGEFNRQAAQTVAMHQHLSVSRFRELPYS